MKGVIWGEAREQSVVDRTVDVHHVHQSWEKRRRNGIVRVDSAGVLDRVRQRHCIVYVRVSSCSASVPDGMRMVEHG